MNNVVVFNDKLPPNYGGMETHFMHAMNYFKNDANWTCKFVVSKHQDKEILLDSNLNVIMTFKNACDLGTYLSILHY